MKRLLLILALIVTLSTGTLAIYSGNTTMAVDVIGPACDNPNKAERPKICDDNQSNASGSDNPILGPNGLVTKGVNILSIIVGIFSVVVIIISGASLITSGGNSENVGKARKGIVYAVVGLIITLFAQIIINFILNKV